MSNSPHRPVAMVADSPSPDNLETNTASFELYCDSKYLAARTIKTYLEAVNGFADYLRDHGVTDVGTISRDHINGYLASLRERGCKPATLANRFRSLQQFFNFLSDPEEGRIDHNPMAGMKPPRVPKPHTPVLEDAQLKAILKTASGTGFRDRRDAAILRVFMDTGRRLFEVAGLSVDDVDLRNRELRITEKGGTERLVPIGAKTAQAIDRYLYERQRRGIEGPELWYGKRGPQTSTGIAQMVGERAEAAGVGHVHPHQFRHTFAHRWLHEGGNEGDLMAIAGWRSRELLDRYGASTAQKRASDAHAKLRLGDQL